MHAAILFSAGLLGLAVALPGNKPYGYGYGGKGKKPLVVDANFNDLTPAPLDLEPVGVYEYLNYVGFSVGTEELLGQQLFGVTPHTPPNVAYSDAISSLFAGPSMQADYAGSKTKSFTLKSFYYGCVDVTETSVATAENCTITATGYRGTDLVATQSFTYGGDATLNADLDATMTLGTFDSTFNHVTEVDFTYVSIVQGDTPPAFIADDFVYNVYLQKKPWN